MAALASNEATKALIKRVLGEDDNLVALFVYAIIATLNAVAVLLLCSKSDVRAP